MEGFGNGKEKRGSKGRAGKEWKRGGSKNLTEANKQRKGDPYGMDARAQGAKGLGDEFEFC
jgi:hypothetical protein